MTKPKMSLKPAQKSVDEFIGGARHVDGDFPWNAPHVRDDVMKLVSLRLAESYALKLQWISEQTGIPQQKYLRDWLLPLIDEKIDELLDR